MRMSSPATTTDRPATVTIIDAEGVEESLLLIDGQPLEQYFAKSGVLTPPAEGQVAIVDGLPFDLASPLSTDTEVLIGILPSNG